MWLCVFVCGLSFDGVWLDVCACLCAFGVFVCVVPLFALCVCFVCELLCDGVWCAFVCVCVCVRMLLLLNAFVRVCI